VGTARTARGPERFDRAYFDRWYRSPTRRIGTAADLERLVHFAVAATEYVLARPLRSVLDAGAGEGRWAPVLQRLRPRATYVGVDPSEYALARFGARRHIVRGTFDDLSALFGRRTFDLVVCSSVLNYLPPRTMARALRQLAAHTHGVAYLEVYTTSDEVMGDTAGWYAASPRVTRERLRRAGFVACGLGCYVPADAAHRLIALERG